MTRKVLARWRARLRDSLRARFQVVPVEDDFPEQLAARRLYVLSEDGLEWAAAMACPCGCGCKLQLNLLPDQRPRWSVALESGGPTLKPSVWQRGACGAHFVLRAGRVYWTPDQPQRLLRDLRLWWS